MLQSYLLVSTIVLTLSHSLAFSPTGLATSSSSTSTSTSSSRRRRRSIRPRTCSGRQEATGTAAATATATTSGRSSNVHTNDVSLMARPSLEDGVDDDLHPYRYVSLGSRRQWLSAAMVSTACLGLFVAAGDADAAQAEEGASEANTAATTTTTTTATANSSTGTGTSATYSISKCDTTNKAPCVSTANVRNLDLYLPPWTFERPTDEVMSRLKGAIVSDSACTIETQDGNQYLKVQAKRGDLFQSVDELEFVINDKDQVVTFRSAAAPDDNMMDFGGMQKKRLEDIRKRAGIFGVMGDALNTADSVSVGERGNGPLGQLKAFYGLQSGGGFEDVVLE